MPANNLSPSAAKFYLVPLLLFVIIAAGMYPFFQFRIISDDFSYLAIAQRYINGDYATAINGYWSPLNIWLLAAVVKCTGAGLLPASYILNAVSFAGLVSTSIYLSGTFLSSVFERMGFGICLALFCAFNIPVTHFADALNCFLLLLCFSILIKPGFITNPKRWILWGIVAAIAYFSKAYSFYILPLTLAIAVILLLKRDNRLSPKTFSFIFGTAVGIMILVSFPWLYLLHEKYGVWMLSSAGGINTNWAIEGHIYFGSPYDVLVPPAYPNGLSCWEDPWINHGKMLSPFGSMSLLGKQVFRMCMNALNWFNVTAQFSALYFPIWIAGVFALFGRKEKRLSNAWTLLIITFLVFPAGYLMLSFGTRYLWFTVPLVMMLGLFLSKEYLTPYLKQPLYKVFLTVYFISWLPGSVQEMKLMFREGKWEYEVATFLNDAAIKGSFLTNTYDNYQTGFRLSWYTQNKFYMHFGDNWNTAALIGEAKKQGVQYYYYFYDGANDDYQLLDTKGKPYTEVTADRFKGLKVFRLER